MTVSAAQPTLLSAILLLFTFIVLITRPALPSKASLLPPPTLPPSPSRPASPSRLPSQTLLQSPSKSNNGSSNSGSSPHEASNRMLTLPRLKPVPYITTYRSQMILMTILAILAVDFPVFPRYLAKCESFGVSLMDLGVGSFVFSQGLISALPVLRDGAYLTAPLVPKMIDMTKKVLPLLGLGLIRVILVKGSDYPEHVTEYGVHWNFFLTLAFLPPMFVLLHPLISYIPLPAIGLSITFVHECALRLTQLQSWTLSADRNGVIAMNKEGIVSIPGYLAIHTFGFLIGTLLLPPSPSHFRRQVRLSQYGKGNEEILSSERQPGKAAIELCSYAIVWWVLCGIAIFFSVGEDDLSPISRRLANVAYVLWVTAFNSTFLLGYLLLDTYFFHPRSPPRFSHNSRDDSDDEDEDTSVKQRVLARVTAELPMPTGLSPRRAKRPPFVLSDGVEKNRPVLSVRTIPAADHRREAEVDGEEDRRAPELLEALNVNGLGVFLLANILTGLVNMSIKTMYTSDTTAIVVLLAYAGLVCWVAWLSRFRRII